MNPHYLAAHAPREKQMNKILVTGATGNIATDIVPQLVRARADVRAMVHDAAKAAPIKALGAETIIGDYGDKASLEKALDGVSTVLFLTPPGPDAWTQARDFLDIAKRNPKLRIVRISALKASVSGPTPNTRLHGQTDDAIRDLQNPYVVLRPHFFMQNLLGQRTSIASEGKIALSMGDGRLGLVDTRDIADVATRVVLDSSWDFGTYEITGPESLTFAEMAATLTKVLRKEITYVPLPLAAVEPAAPWFDRTMHDYSAAYAANWGDYTSGLVEKITGRKARSFDTFAREVLMPTLQ